MSVPKADILLAYRHLHKQLLRAVQYSKPARYTVRDHIRTAFREQPASDYDAARISRTLEFLEGATKVKGLEHKILKNLVFVWWDKKQARSLKISKERAEYRKGAYDDYNHTLRMLEDSMGITLG